MQQLDISAVPGQKKEKKPLHEYPDVNIATEMHTHIGLYSMRHNSLHTIDKDIVISASGNLVLFINYKTGTIKSITGPPGGGVGAVTVHPSKNCFVVCEKASENPRVVVYSYPEMAETHVMTNGAVIGFSSCAFNVVGNFLATVGIDPDYTLTIWDWKQQITVLRNKAFSSDVYKVAFCPFNEGTLITCGMGHLKVWTMASTFTGLKLQGAIGKFGRVEISDICAAVTFPSGKILSGSEFGSLLLWEGNVVKCDLRRLDDISAKCEDNGLNKDVPLRPCHDGNIGVVQFVEGNTIIMTAGDDGYVRYWKFSDIEMSENDGVDLIVGVRCLMELLIGHGVKAKSVTLSKDKSHWIMLDGSGSIRTFPYFSASQIMSPNTLYVKDALQPSEPLLRFFSGGINTLSTSPVDHTVVAGGADGSLRLFDYINSKEVYTTKFDSEVVCVKFFHSDKDSAGPGTHMFCGFADGCVRLVRRCRDAFEVLEAFRPHNAKLCAISFDVAMTQMYTAADDNTAFYFKLSDHGLRVEPIGFCRLPGSLVTCMEWSQEGDVCFMGFDNGEILALDPPHEEIDHSVGYEFVTHYAGVGYRQRMNPPPKEKILLPTGEYEDDLFDEEEDEELDNGPWRVNFIHRLPPSISEEEHDTAEYVIGVHKEELAYKYNCNIRYTDKRGPPLIPPTGVDPPGRVEEPHGNVCYRNYVPLSAETSPDKTRMVLVCEQSRVIIQDISMMGTDSNTNERQNVVYHAKQFHDGIDGKISAANLSYDGTFLITAGLHDGLIVVQLLDGKSLPTDTELHLNSLPIANELKKRPISVANSIQQQKILDDAKKLNDMAEGKKSRMIRKINEVHLEYNKILLENDNAENGKKLSEEEIALDPELLRLLDQEKDKRVSEAAVDYSWQVAWKEKLLKQLRDAFVDNLTYDRFTLHSFGNKFSVSSLRAPALTWEHEEKVAHLQELMSYVNKSDLPTTDEECKRVIQQGILEKEKFTNTHSNIKDKQARFDTNGDFSESLKRSNRTTVKKSATQTQLDRAEERRIERLERKMGYEKLLSQKPKPTDPDLIGEAAYRDTKENMGDFILKTSPEHRVSLHLVPTAEQKAKELIMLDHSMHHLRVQFNQNLLQLRDLKRKLIIRLNKDRNRLKEFLSPNEEAEIPPKFSLLREEEPEKRFEASHETIVKLAKERAKQKRRDEAAKKDKGFGADLAQFEEDETDSEDNNQKTMLNSRRGTVGIDRRSIYMKHASLSLTNTRMTLRESSHHGLLTIKEKVEMELQHRLENVRLSELEEEEVMIQREIQQYEKNRILKHINATLEAFNDKLMVLHHEGMKLTADMCMADMRAILIYREFRMLINFQKKDNELSEKYTVKEIEQHENIERSKELRNHVEEVNLKQLTIGAALKRISDEAEMFIVNNFFPDDHPYLRKVFTRKIKRRKCVDENDDDDDAPTSDDEDELDDEDFDECCPTTCDPEHWEMLLELRERRLDCVDADEEIKKNLSTLTTSLKNLNDRYETVKTELNASSVAIDNFQVEKQRRLNLLETVVVLKLSQVQCLHDETRKLPLLYNNPEIIVFTVEGINKLRQRIIQLAEDKKNLRGDSEALSMDRLKLLRRKTKHQIEHNEWDKKVYDVQLLKFGQKVDLDALEGVAMNREIEELKEKLKVEEIKWGRELRKEDAKVGILRHENQSRIGENTMLLQNLGNLRSHQHDLEAQVTQNSQKIVSKMYGGSKIATVEERIRLKKIISAQQDQIDSYKVEIDMLRHKGGHLFTPIVQKQDIVNSPPTTKTERIKQNELMQRQGFAATAMERHMEHHNTLQHQRPIGSAPVSHSYDLNGTDPSIGEPLYQSKDNGPHHELSDDIHQNDDDIREETHMDSHHSIDKQHAEFREHEQEAEVQDEGQPQVRDDGISMDYTELHIHEEPIVESLHK